MIAFNCSGCGKKLTVKDEQVGKRVQCPQCKRVLAAMATPQRAVSAPPPPPPRPAPLPTSAFEPTVAAAPEDTPSVVGAAAGNFNFLRAPEGPGELGRLGNYRVLKVLGAGGMGMVLQAEDPLLKRNVALKVMRAELASSEQMRRRFLREAQATAAIEHPNIVHIYQVGEDRGVPYLAMPFLKGETLDARLQREGRLPAPEVVRIGKQVADGLAAAHEHGLIHRDIKPANIWLEASTGWVKIVDFGLARAAVDDTHLTATGTVLGTPAYMAPEQARSESVDHRCDLFSLGAVLYRMTTGELPFKGKDTMSILMSLANTVPKPVHELYPGTPRPLSDLIAQLLAKDQNKRPASAKAVSQALTEVESDRTVLLEQPRQPARASRLLPVVWKLAALPWRLGVGLYRMPGRKGKIARWVVGIFLVLLLLNRLGNMLSDPKQVAKQGTASKELQPEGMITNSIGMKLALLPAGEFLMGSPDMEKERAGESAPRTVKIAKSFYIGVTEVTQAQFREVTGKNPAFFQESVSNPVELVPWEDAVDFCNKLSELPKEKEAKRRYRLPTEEEWEYACRAGTTTPFHSGDSLSSHQANFNGNNPYGDAQRGPYIGRTTTVGNYKANAFGLHDMHGNVWEWCSGNGAEGRVLRGGSWFGSAARCRSAVRNIPAPSARDNDIGFRVVCVTDKP